MHLSSETGLSESVKLCSSVSETEQDTNRRRVWHSLPFTQMDRWAQILKKPNKFHERKTRRLPDGMISIPAFYSLRRQFPPTPEKDWSRCDSVCMRTRGRLQQKKNLRPQIPRLAPLILHSLPTGFSFVSFSVFCSQCDFPAVL